MIPQLPQISQYTVMTNDISVYVNVSDRAHLQWLIADRNTPRKVVWRAEIVLATGDDLGTMAIIRRTGQSKPCVWRWQERFVAEGVAGLLRDKRRPSQQEATWLFRPQSGCPLLACLGRGKADHLLEAGTDIRIIQALRRRSWLSVVFG
jgi:hypothetical protein